MFSGRLRSPCFRVLRLRTSIEKQRGHASRVESSTSDGRPSRRQRLQVRASDSRASRNAAAASLKLHPTPNQRGQVPRDIQCSSDTVGRNAHLFDEEIAFTADMKNRQRVLRMIRRKPGIEFRTILANAKVLKRNLDPVIETLVAEGQIERREKGYWPVGTLGTVGDADANTKRPQFTRVK